MEIFCEIMRDMGNDVSRMKEVSENVPEQMEYAIGQCKFALDRMCELASKADFTILNCKFIFSKRSNHLFTTSTYHQPLFQIVINRRKIDKDEFRRYLLQEPIKLTDFTNLF